VQVKLAAGNSFGLPMLRSFEIVWVEAGPSRTALPEAVALVGVHKSKLIPTQDFDGFENGGHGMER
jgi:hypothetical protein